MAAAHYTNTQMNLALGLQLAESIICTVSSIRLFLLAEASNSIYHLD